MGMSFLWMIGLVPYKLLSRYEFAPNEFVNSLACVPLETLSTESGQKHFIAVGTTINRGEDLAVKGAVSFHCTAYHPRLFLISPYHRLMFLRSSKLCPTLRR